MGASRGLSPHHNGPPTKPRPLIPILLFHTSFQSTHATGVLLPLSRSSVPTMPCDCSWLTIARKPSGAN